MNSIKLSILILAYNGGQDAIDAVASLKDERHLVDKILISDNHSTDGTKELLKEQSDILKFDFLERKQNLGFAGGFNDLFTEGLKRSDAQYFLILNNDTIAEENFLENLLNEAQPNKVVSPMILWHQDRESVIQCAGTFNREMMKMDNLFAEKKRFEVPVGTHDVEQTDGCCFLIHRKWLEKGLGFDPNFFIYFEDVELFTRLRQEGLSFHYVSSSVLLHKEYGSSGGRFTPSPFRNYYFYRNRLYLCKKLHPGLRRFRIYWRLIRLALEQYKKEKLVSRPAAQAILKGMADFFMGRMGKGI